MKLKNGFYVDENNNRWDSDRYTKEHAEQKSKSLNNCSDCSDCSYCYNCSDCSGCYGCSNCSNCSGCSDCSYCSDCSCCSGCSCCSNCSNCSNCSHCSDCYNCSDCSDCSDCSHCSDCYNCSYCSDCSDCSDFKDNPMRYTGTNIGSKKSQTTAYWKKEKTLVVCGCWKGTLEEFKERVKEVHGDNQYGKEYEQYIKIVKAIIEMEKVN
ncbi:MAG TPA: hypothetical protein VMX17_16765 [Candidatus Glassbacteria bacterium]|nr:hypothetical protein [Candidatus Glassbacteria bacterium]